jgi:hypothetical protein
MSSNYEYSSSSSKGDADASELFAQADTNRDGIIDLTEFANLIGSSDAASAGASFDAKKTGSRYGSSSYESSKYSSGGGVTDVALVGYGGGRSSYESSRYSAGVGVEDVGRNGTYQSSSYESTSDFDASALKQAASYTADSNTAWSRYGAEVRGIGLYFDSNPEIIRREVPGDIQTYTQTIRVRFFQPPPASPPGVS